MNRSQDLPVWSPAARGYRRLVVWQRAHELVSALYRLTGEMRLDSWLQGQIMRAAMSVSANIVEGNARGSARDYVRFLDMAFASLAEVDYFLYFLHDNSLLKDEAYESLVPLIDEIGNKLIALMRSVSKADKEGTWQRISEEPAEYLALSDLESVPHLPSPAFHLPGAGERPGG
ncbi:MAG TPA: four helix bundle protein [Dehalococcoidia bacterium]|nr:four helix bundle protein [Dehalococcoidia bacterium]